VLTRLLADPPRRPSRPARSAHRRRGRLQKGTYRVAVNYETLFCAGHTWMSDGNLVAAGGDMGASLGAAGDGSRQQQLAGLQPGAQPACPTPSSSLSPRTPLPIEAHSLPLPAPGVIGGTNSYPFMREGRDVVRVFDRKTQEWTTLPGVKLSEYRWYPT
jgi:hypothetical protein